MQTKRRDLFATITTEGSILPVDLLQRISEGDRDLDGLTSESYHLSGEKLNEAVSRSWNRLLGAWSAFQKDASRLPETDLGTSVSRERWLLPLFSVLGYGRLVTAKAIEIEGKSYPISHGWQNVPIHLIGFRVDLDERKARVAGAARSSPHSMVQEFLNRSKDHLWAFVSNGLQLRMLRDNVSLTRQAYVEFDLESMMRGEIYSDFVLLWLLCHQSRVEAERPEEFWLERWSKVAAVRGTRALDQLRVGVEQAITFLGRGFLVHPANKKLRDRLQEGTLIPQDYYRQLLRLVYRLLFLFVAEDRELLSDPKADPKAVETYRRYYSATRLRQLAERRGTKHLDLFRALTLVMCKLEAGCVELGLPALGSFLWSKEAVPDIAAYDIPNRDLLDAVRALAFTVDGNVLRPVDYKNLGSEELGSIYESLLELHPELNVSAGTFELKTSGGHERKTTGSYYTPTSLITCLLDSALDPVVTEAVKKPNPEQALLNLKICDPACGSGHFLIAAAHRLAKRLASIRTGDEEPAPDATRHALRDVIGRCIYGVDVNPMAVELCKVSLWMEALEPGKPLSFLDHRIQCGNSLLGTTPALLAKGIPDEAFKPIEGDEKKYCTEWKKRNKKERETGQETLFDAADAPWEKLGNLAVSMANLDDVDDGTIEGIKKRQEMYESLVKSSGYLFGHLLADAWCAAFVWRMVKDDKFPYPITEDVFRKIERSPYSVAPWIKEEIQRLANQYQFFHWHLAFPDVFRPASDAEAAENELTGWSGGFDIVLGNPPWERIKIQEKEWFAERNPDIAAAPNAAARRKMIKNLAQEDPNLLRAFMEDKRKAEGESHLVRNSGRYPLCGRGDVNTYTVFAETNRTVISGTGRVGCIVPSGIATDDTTKFFFNDLMSSGSLVSLFDFQSGPGLFGEIGHARFKFCLLTLTGNQRQSEGAEFAFFLRDTALLRDAENRFTLTADDLELLNPNTRTCPIFRSRRDAEITKAIYRRVPILIKEGPPEENPWGISFMAMFHMANDSHLFRTREQLERDGWVLEGNVFSNGNERYLPLYEAKMIHHFNHRFGDYRDKPEGSESTALPDVPVERLNDPNYTVLPRYWVPENAVDDRLAGKWDKGWLLGWRDICRSTDERTVIAGIIPRAGVGHKFPLALHVGGNAYALAACLQSFCFDYVARQKLGGTSMTYFTLKQLPALAPLSYKQKVKWDKTQTIAEFILPRVVELVCTSKDMDSFGADHGYADRRFIWNEYRRFAIRCELDACFFHLYGISREDVDYIMETFHIVKRKDDNTFEKFRTKLTVLEIFDAMGEAVRTGTPYQTRLDPPPGDR